MDLQELARQRLLTELQGTFPKIQWQSFTWMICMLVGMML
jgi:hypothetical protein